MKRWEKEPLKRLTKYFLLGLAAGLILGLVTSRLGLFLPLGGIVGMCAGIMVKK